MLMHFDYPHSMLPSWLNDGPKSLLIGEGDTPGFTALVDKHDVFLCWPPSMGPDGEKWLSENLESIAGCHKLICVVNLECPLQTSNFVETFRNFFVFVKLNGHGQPMNIININSIMAIGGVYSLPHETHMYPISEIHSKLSPLKIGSTVRLHTFSNFFNINCNNIIKLHTVEGVNLLQIYSSLVERIACLLDPKLYQLERFVVEFEVLDIIVDVADVVGAVDKNNHIVKEIATAVRVYTFLLENFKCDYLCGTQLFAKMNIKQDMLDVVFVKS